MLAVAGRDDVVLGNIFSDRGRLPSLVPRSRLAGDVCALTLAFVSYAGGRNSVQVSVKSSAGIATGSPGGGGAVRYLKRTLLAGASRSRISCWKSSWKASRKSVST